MLVASRDVEDALYAHEAVGEIAVIGLPHDRWIEAIAAVVVPREGASVEEAKLIAFAKDHLAAHKTRSGCISSDTRMSEIGRTRLDEALSALGELLDAARSSAHLVVVGGSGLIAIDVVSRTTRDVDVVALNQDGVLISAQPLPDPVVKAASVVARDLGLEPNWLNCGPTSLLQFGLPAGFEDRVIERGYGPGLRVSFASRIDQIHLKLYAAADRREPRDFDDLERLAPTPAELHAAARWARTHNMPGPFDDALARALRDLGVEDAGRDV